MGLYGDPDALDSLASELHQRAQLVRRAADEHRAQAARAHWVSTAASAYRRRVTADCADVEAAAEALDHAAVVLRRHADEVRDRIAAIARAERAVRTWVAHQEAKGEQLLGDAGHLIGRLPAAGAEAWEHVAGSLTRLGAW